ncbi:MAG: hypothetical protein OXU20_01925 [Myxococcales bacterium]|nr:hypothetical protein [Myxococcales bacterium]MDD9969010.1 hypothetical protein [Myxococcales bacterium]
MIKWLPWLMLAVAVGSGGCGRLGFELLSAGHTSTREETSSHQPDARTRNAGMDAGLDGMDAEVDAEASAKPGLDAARDAADAREPTDACNDGCTDICTPDDSCGVGYCRLTNTPSTCDDPESTCVPGTPLAADDGTCDGVDDDCDGQVDEDYSADDTCGTGYCFTTNAPSNCLDGVETMCQAGTPLSMDDTTADAVDDDCDGVFDEDACEALPMAFGPGVHALSAPVGCPNVTVQLWGGGGGSSDAGGAATMGPGGAGGFAQSTVPATGSLELYVGLGGNGCTGGGTNPGSATYAGGAGGVGELLQSFPGDPGADGVVAGGGAGGRDSEGSNGGDGHYGGGGGGAGATAPWPPYPTTGGGGGAATVLHQDGLPVVVAGGGGGGGSASGASNTPPYYGSQGGEGCSGTGGDSNRGGGGGGGGVCVGDMTASGEDGIPAHSALLPGNEAVGATGTACESGGNGYAIVLFEN